MLLPATSYNREGHAMFGHLEIGYRCWLGSIGALFIVSMLADRRTADRHRNIDTRVLDERTGE